jgi:hypothetical protein
MVSCPIPAHPRQMDFSFMSLPPLPPAIFPSLPLRQSPTPLTPAMTFTIRYQPPSSAVCLFHIFCHHRCQVSPPVFVDRRMGSIALPPFLFSHLPRLPLNFLPHQNGTPSSVDCCFFNCGLSSSSSSWCLPPGGILDGMGALSLSFPLAVFPPYPSLLRLPSHLLAHPSLGGRPPA